MLSEGWEREAARRKCWGHGLGMAGRGRTLEGDTERELGSKVEARK